MRSSSRSLLVPIEIYRHRSNLDNRPFTMLSVRLVFACAIVSLYLCSQVKMAESRPLVEVDKRGEDRVVGVNLPWIYSMDLLTGKKGTGLGISVLSGLVRIDVDTRNKANDGRRPVRVSLLGGKLYDSFPAEKPADDSPSKSESKRPSSQVEPEVRPDAQSQPESGLGTDDNLIKK